MDVDPERKAGTASSDEEHEGALVRAQAIEDFLRATLGFPEPVTADSGNGGHRLWRIDLPNDEASRDLIKHALEALDYLFSDECQKVDTGNFNAARIWKLYGTVAHKGEDTPDRPHRLAKLLRVPGHLGIVTREQLEALAAMKPNERQATKDQGTDGKALDLEAWLEEHSIEYTRVKPFAGGSLYVLEACPWSENHSDGEDGASVGQFANGALFFQCHHSHCADKDWQAFREYYEPGIHERKARPSTTQMPTDPTYTMTPSGITMLKHDRDGNPRTVRLTNFTACIVADVSEDNGVEERRVFEIEAQVVGKPATRFTVQAEKFGSLNWPMERLGSQAIVYPGQLSKEHARVAIQLLSGDVEEMRVYTHTGWRKLDSGERVFLHANGAVLSGSLSGNESILSGENTLLDNAQAGNEAGLAANCRVCRVNCGIGGLQVRLPKSVARYAFPDASVSPIEAVRASLKMLEVAPASVTVPIFASIWRAPLGQADFSLHIAGKTGTGKSELAALAQQHYGPEMDARHLPGNWSSTANALEGLQFAAKDVLLVIDEFKPTGNANEVSQWHSKADRVLRAQGNGSSRMRLNADLTAREGRPPRGLTLSTGEDIPRGHSLKARMLALRMPADGMKWEGLTSAQADARNGVYAEAMAGYLAWLAPQYETIQKRLTKEKARLRERVMQGDQHKRTPEIVANLLIGLKYFLLYAEAIGALTVEERNRYFRDWFRVLQEVGLDQAEHQEADEPTTRFAELLKTALLTRACLHIHNQIKIAAMVTIAR